MKTLNEVVDASDIGSAVFFLQLLEITDQRRQEILQWFADQDIELDALSADTGTLFQAKFDSPNDAKLAEWINRWENADGSSPEPDAYRMIQINVI